jgi:hypothetical protein
MVGIRSPDGLVVGLAPATLEFWVRFPNERNQGKQAHPVLKYRVPHGSQPRPGWAPDPLMVGIRSPDGLVVGLAPATLEFWVRFPNERNQGKQAHPVLKYRVPHGSQPRPGWAPDPLMVGIRSPDGLVVGLAPATLEFWVRFPNERNQGKQAHPVLKYRVPHGSQPRPGWAPDPLMVGIRSPDGLVVGLAPATLEFWVRFPNERNQGKQAHPVLKYRVPHGSQPRPGWAPDPLMVGIRSPDGLVVGLAPATLEFWVRFPNERNQGKQAHPVLKYRVPHGSQLKYRVPHGSQCVLGRLIHTGLGSSSLIAHVLHSPPPPTRTAL